MHRYISLLLFIGLAFWGCEEEGNCDWELTGYETYQKVAFSNKYWLHVRGTIKNTGERNINEIHLEWKVTLDDFTTGDYGYSIWDIELPPDNIFSFDSDEGPGYGNGAYLSDNTVTSTEFKQNQCICK